MMLALDPPVPGFTTWDAEGHGFGFSKATTSERVRGRVRRTLITAVLPRDDADHILNEIARQVPIAHLTYWIERVELFGRLQDAASLPSAVGFGSGGSAGGAKR